MISGSHLWGTDRIPTLEECTYAEMAPGSALFTLGGKEYEKAFSSLAADYNIPSQLLTTAPVRTSAKTQTLTLSVLCSHVSGK